jgi:hypothetical protein
VEQPVAQQLLHARRGGLVALAAHEQVHVLHLRGVWVCVRTRAMIVGWWVSASLPPTRRALVTAPVAGTQLRRATALRHVVLPPPRAIRDAAAGSQRNQATHSAHITRSLLQRSLLVLFAPFCAHGGDLRCVSKLSHLGAQAQQLLENNAA